MSINADILSDGPSATNFSEILIKIQIFSCAKLGLKKSYAKCLPFCSGIHVLPQLT